MNQVVSKLAYPRVQLPFFLIVLHHFLGALRRGTVYIVTLRLGEHPAPSRNNPRLKLEAASSIDRVVSNVSSATTMARLVPAVLRGCSKSMIQSVKCKLHIALISISSLLYSSVVTKAVRWSMLFVPIP